MSAVPNTETGLQVVQPTPFAAPARGPRLGLPTRDELSVLMEYGSVVSKSGLFPNVKSAEAAIVMMRYGHQLGIDEFTALQNMYLQNGKPTAFASLLHSLILRDHGGDAVRIVDSTPQRCALSCSRRDSPQRTEVTYTIEEAEAAGLTKKDTWKQYPADMLFARCISRAGRMLYRDSTLGMYTPEELGASVIEVNGEVIDTRPADERVAEVSDPNAHDLAMASLHAQARDKEIEHDALHDLAVAAYNVPSLTECTVKQLTGIRVVARDCTADEFLTVLTVAQEVATSTDPDWLADVAQQVDEDTLPDMAKRLLKATIKRVSESLPVSERV